MDLSAARGRWRARRLLRGAAATAREATRRFPLIRHVVVLYARHPSHDADSLARTAEGLAARLHAAFERRRGSDVEVLAVDVTGCHRLDLIGTRISDLAATAPGAVGNRIVQWPDLAKKSLHRAAMDELL